MLLFHVDSHDLNETGKERSVTKGEDLNSNVTYENTLEEWTATS